MHEYDWSLFDNIECFWTQMAKKWRNPQALWKNNASPGWKIILYSKIDFTLQILSKIPKEKAQGSGEIERTKLPNFRWIPLIFLFRCRFIKTCVRFEKSNFIIRVISTNKSVSFTCTVSNWLSSLGIRRLTCGVDSLTSLRLLRFATVGGLVLNLVLTCFPRVSRRLIPTRNFDLLVPAQSVYFL